VIDVIIFNSDDTLVLLLHYSLIVINVVIVICLQCFDAVGFVWQEGHPAHKNMGEWWRWALVSPDRVAASQMVSVSVSVNLPLHHKVQKFSSGTGSPR